MLITQEHFKKIYNENTVCATCLVLIINNDCNANCRACLAQQVFKSALCKELCEAFETCKYLRCCDHIAPDEEYYARLEEILSTINSPHVDIIITGGEPTISHRFVPVLEIIEKYNFPSKVLQLETNGANLKNKAISEAIKKYNVKIHLSRYSKDDEANLEEFRFKELPTTNQDIKEFSEIYGDLLGISTVLLKKHIASGRDLLDMVEHSVSLGVHHHDFLEVMADTTLESSNANVLAYYNEQLITAEQLRNEILDLGAVCTSDFRIDSYGYSVYSYKDYTFSITYSKLNLQHRQETNNYFSRFLIMPSGEIGINGVEKR
jgi:organic radical activating enzyme